MRPVDSKAYQGRAASDSEIFGPARAGGAANASRAPAYSRLANPSRINPSPMVNGGVRGNAGL